MPASPCSASASSCTQRNQHHKIRGRANFSDRGLSFINADYTVYLGREPRGEYVGIQPDGHLSERGVAAGRCVLHDLGGPVGFAGTTAVANPTLG